MTGDLVVVCPTCDGMTFTLGRCSCAGDGEPYPQCRLCQGIGSVARACHGCGQTGRRRSQLVVTVANLDTGAVASANVVPGSVRPCRWPYGAGWHLPVAPLLRDLAARVGAAGWHEHGGRSPDGPILFLPPKWRSDLPEQHRHALEADAIARHSHSAWLVYLGRNTARPAPDPTRELDRLRRVADLLRLDLVLEVRRLPRDDHRWDIRYEVHGSPVPDRPRGWADDLPAALLATTVEDALFGLADRGRTAPAHYLLAGAPQRPAEPVAVEVLERRLLADLTDPRTGEPTAGAQAIWRDGRWWHTSLRVAGSTETLVEEPTGRVVSRLTTNLRRGWQPPAPAWLGPPIPYAECPACDKASRLRPCGCTVGDRPADPACEVCFGAGRYPSALPCFRCGDSRRIYRGAAVTISDLATRVTHLNWTGGAADAPLVATQPGGKPVHQLPAGWRLAGWATSFGVRPEELSELDRGGPIGDELRDGIVTVDHAGADPVLTNLAEVTRGRPAARVLVSAVRPDVPPLAAVIRLGIGLGLAVTVTIRDHIGNVGDPRLIQGESWDVRVGSDPADPPCHHTIEAAVASFLGSLEITVSAAVPADPAVPIAVPQALATALDPIDPVRLIRRLGRHHAGQAVAVRYERGGCHLHLRERDEIRHLATAPDLVTALTALGLR
ncbi:hypothetical protein O7627_07585 [Solwaraspora sp. WMMD1047]|uniref:hypothetical protein n=1 Tax=Solwaraspora sp. WMMD1047 TaxID=3016102 RepID=UPI002415CFAC|nr:hypothetical protein [Solwaraspora sp. WMMD1047]MDG4829167.1 hypothetical protein [Solwaraspora sp. WMMD1047]